MLLSIVQDESPLERPLSPTPKEAEREEEAEPVVMSKKLGTTRQLSGDIGTSSGLPPVSPARSIPRSGKGSPILKPYTIRIYLTGNLNDLYLPALTLTHLYQYCCGIHLPLNCLSIDSVLILYT